MSIQRYRNDNPRTAEEIADAIEFELQSINPKAPVVRGTQNYAFLNAMAAVLSENQEQSLVDLYDAAYITDASGEELTKRCRGIGIQRQEPVPSTGVAKFTRSSPATSDYLIQSGTTVSTGGNNPATFDTTQQVTIDGPRDETDSSTYSTSNTSYEEKVTYTVTVDYRDSLEVSADLRIDNSNYTAFVEIADATNGQQIGEHQTTTTTYTTFGPDSYDVSSLTGDIDIEFRIRVDNVSGTAELQNANIDVPGQTGAETNIECNQTGPGGNVGADTIVVLVDKPTGVEAVTNPESTGDPSFTLTDGSTPLTTGQDREEDESLRERALDSAVIGGAGTADAAAAALENIEDVISADVFTNRTSGTQNNVDPWHTEIRVYGGAINDIANQLYEVFPLPTLKTLHGGANGTLESTTITRSELYGDLSIEITRPTEIDLEITVDLVHDATYAGTTDVKNAIVDYIGGTTTDQRSIPGLGQGDNVIVNEVENVAEDVTGVDAVTSSLIDDNSDGSDDTTTDSDGVQVYSVTDSEVPVVAASDITVNETAR